MLLRSGYEKDALIKSRLRKEAIALRGKARHPYVGAAAWPDRVAEQESVGAMYVGTERTADTPYDIYITRDGTRFLYVNAGRIIEGGAIARLRRDVENNEANDYAVETYRILVSRGFIPESEDE